MTNITTIPLEDDFKTELSQTWTWWTWTVNVTRTPTFTFPAGQTCYIVANPWNSNMQIAEINAYDGSAKTLTVSNITLEKWAGVNSTAQTHNVWNEIIISDNYQIWLDILTAINTKVDWDVQWFPSYTTTNRDLISASNGMMVYNTTTGELNQYIGWAWSAVAAWSTQADASTTVAGKVEIATDAEVTAGTWTGWTGAVLSVTATQANTLVSLATTDTTSSDTDYWIFQDAAASDVNKKQLQSNVRESLAASETVKGTAERATDAEAVTWTDTERYVTPAQAVLKTDSITLSRNNATATSTVQYSHNLWRVPKLITFHAIEATNTWSHWAYDGTTDNVVYATWTPWAGSSDVLSIRTQGSSGTNYTTGTVSAMTTTTFDITWTRTWTPTGTAVVLTTLIA